MSIIASAAISRAYSYAAEEHFVEAKKIFIVARISMIANEFIAKEK